MKTTHHIVTTAEVFRANTTNKKNLAPGVAPGYAAGLNEWNVKKEGMTKKLLLAIDYVSRSALGLLYL
ncbi:hypothetical protein T4A_11591 [Trichinella pseudospiralis]|uniref:Uncharacterized protein n=1 Tax=Trichinella pseudospiralis TaxID=6337 RepID=A0A0V1E629_TRIPS|nr:hypothetical protein T4A_11591 [Trichinella pseudospiralis]